MLCVANGVAPTTVCPILVIPFHSAPRPAEVRTNPSRWLIERVPQRERICKAQAVSSRLILFHPLESKNPEFQWFPNGFAVKYAHACFRHCWQPINSRCGTSGATFTETEMQTRSKLPWSLCVVIPTSLITRHNTWKTLPGRWWPQALSLVQETGPWKSKKWRCNKFNW